jgi:FKBP-type peptidyl-prolyl cis-trans isomerase 2
VFDEGEIEFNAGAGQMISGFDQAVLGMCAGEEKDVSIHPEEAYGQRYEELVYVLPLEFAMERYLTVSEDAFVTDVGSEPVVGETYFKPSIYIMPLKVTDISGGNVTMEKAVTAGFVMNDAEPWPIAVVSINDTHIDLVREVSDGETVVTAYGEKTVSVEDGNLTVDLNHFLAGETLNFHIKVLEVTKSQ